MKTTLFALALAAVFALAPQAQAGDKHKKKHKDSSHHRSSQNSHGYSRNSHGTHGNRYLVNPYYGGYSQQYDSHQRRDSHRRSGPRIHIDF